MGRLKRLRFNIIRRSTTFLPLCKDPAARANQTKQAEEKLTADEVKLWAPPFWRSSKLKGLDGSRRLVFLYFRVKLQQDKQNIRSKLQKFQEEFMQKEGRLSRIFAPCIAYRRTWNVTLEGELCKACWESFCSVWIPTRVCRFHLGLLSIIAISWESKTSTSSISRSRRYATLSANSSNQMDRRKLFVQFSHALYFAAYHQTRWDDQKKEGVPPSVQFSQFASEKRQFGVSVVKDSVLVCV